jgi:hypothetical protein
MRVLSCINISSKILSGPAKSARIRNSGSILRITIANVNRRLTTDGTRLGDRYPPSIIARPGARKRIDGRSFAFRPKFNVNLPRLSNAS